MDDLEDKILEITALEAHAMKNTQRNAPDTDNVTAVEKDTADVTAVENDPADVTAVESEEVIKVSGNNGEI